MDEVEIEKKVEVTFKYHLPDNEDDVYLNIHAKEMYFLLLEIDRTCRGILKHGCETIKSLDSLCQKIRDMISENIDLDKIS